MNIFSPSIKVSARDTNIKRIYYLRGRKPYVSKIEFKMQGNSSCVYTQSYPISILQEKQNLDSVKHVFALFFLCYSTINPTASCILQANHFGTV